MRTMILLSSHFGFFHGVDVAGAESMCRAKWEKVRNAIDCGCAGDGGTESQQRRVGRWTRKGVVGRKDFCLGRCAGVATGASCCYRRNPERSKKRVHVVVEYVS